MRQGDPNLHRLIREALAPSGERTIVVTERDDLLPQLAPARKGFLGVVNRKAVLATPRFVQAVRFESGDCLIEVGANAIHEGRVAEEDAAELARRGFAHTVDVEGRRSEQLQRLLPATDVSMLETMVFDAATVIGLTATDANVEAWDA